MSCSKDYCVRCVCGESFSAKLYDIINAQKNPELKKELIEGKINVVICPKCKKRLFIDKILLFHDPSKELMVQLFPKRFRENETVIREELEKTINEKVENGNLLTDAPVIPNYMRRPRIAFSIEELATIIKEYDKNEK